MIVVTVLHVLTYLTALHLATLLLHRLLMLHLHATMLIVRIVSHHLLLLLLLLLKVEFFFFLSAHFKPKNMLVVDLIGRCLEKALIVPIPSRLTITC